MNAPQTRTLQMKTARMIELQRQRHELIDEARSVTEEIKTATGDKLDGLGKRHDDIMRSIDLNRLDIDEEAMSNAEDEARAKQRPNLGGGEAFGVDDGLSAFA
ncbi:MAG: hypothetical protein ACK44O_03835, partial [Novosphingobium sp.]